jgi:glycerol-1-phosphatase
MLKSTTEPLGNVHDLLMLDLDGVIYRSRQAIPGAVEALQAYRGVRAFLTNNAARSAATIADHLRSLGIVPISEGDVVTSAQAIASTMAHDLAPGSHVLVVGGAGLREAVAERGLAPVGSLDEKPVAVVQGYSGDIAWIDLAEAAYAIESGLPWYVTNTDMTIPTSRGVAPGNGALVQAVATASGAEPVAIAGKPYPGLFQETITRCPGEHPLMVGDRLDTDILGANRVFIDSLAVLTGVSTLQDIADAAPELRPSYVAPDLTALSQPHPQVDVIGLEARCGQARVAIMGDTIEITTPASPVEQMRAAIELAWTLHDRGTDSVRIGGTIYA